MGIISNTIEEASDVDEFWKLTPAKIRKEKIPIQINKKDSVDIKWPKKVQLRKMVKATPVTRIARELGVSDNAVRKHCNKLGIELPKRGYWQKLKHGKTRKKT